jgi:hypothetical protein
MSKSKHSEAQIIAALKQVEAWWTADDVARECGVFSLSTRSMPGSLGSAAWMPVKHRGCGRWKMRTDASSGWWRT